MPLRKVMKGVPLDPLPAEGILYRDDDALTNCQRECVARVGTTLQLEQESYLSRHPEIRAILETFVSKMSRENKRKGILKEAAEYFTKPTEELESEIKEHLNISDGSSFIKKDAKQFKYKDLKLIDDIQKIINLNYPGEPYRVLTPDASTINTASSSFISIATSDTTLPTPEPIPTPEPTLSETLFSMVSNTVDKAIFLHVDEPALRYDTAYVELKKAVEEAMEIPVIEIKEDIAELYYNSYKMFELNIMEKERIRYETPPTPKSVLSSHESYKKPPPRPCVCHPQFTYNRYPKDRFGIYLPRQVGYSEGNITVTPAVSIESLDEIADTKSIVSKKSAVSAKSAVSKKTTFKE
ncbi:unnamed protein product [Pieris brassicae]|uniref:Uncharacterized protein n=1 Tax=Pieris brassicae TaxID=7116 RepID=A0A9P0TV14_PIEBR|nr:unnamed protein product [Pieris brassicae]